MSIFDPRSKRCVLAELCEKYPGLCTNYDNDLYYGFHHACLHHKAKKGQTKCPLGLVSKGLVRKE